MTISRRTGRTFLGAVALLAGLVACGGGTEPRAADDLTGLWAGGNSYTGRVLIHIDRDDGHEIVGSGEARVPPDTPEDHEEVYGFRISSGTHDRQHHILSIALAGQPIGPRGLQCDLLGDPAIGCSGTFYWGLGSQGVHEEHLTFTRVPAE